MCTRTTWPVALQRSTLFKPMSCPNSNCCHTHPGWYLDHLCQTLRNMTTEACLKLGPKDQPSLELLQSTQLFLELLPTSSPLCWYLFHAHFPSSLNYPPIWHATPTTFPSPWPQPWALSIHVLGYILIPYPLTGTINSLQFIHHECDSALRAPSTYKTSLTPTSFLHCLGNRSLDHTSPCQMVLPSTLPAKSGISSCSFII